MQQFSYKKIGTLENGRLMEGGRLTEVQLYFPCPVKSVIRYYFEQFSVNLPQQSRLPLTLFFLRNHNNYLLQALYWLQHFIMTYPQSPFTSHMKQVLRSCPVHHSLVLRASRLSCAVTAPTWPLNTRYLGRRMNASLFIFMRKRCLGSLRKGNRKNCNTFEDMSLWNPTTPLMTCP